MTHFLINNAMIIVVIMNVTTVIVAIIAAYFAHLAERAALAASSRATVKASEAIRLASLAIDRVSSSRAEPLQREIK